MKTDKIHREILILRAPNIRDPRFAALQERRRAQEAFERKLQARLQGSVRA